MFNPYLENEARIFMTRESQTNRQEIQNVLS
jgi:hypothetical protein